jgi:glycosyltransferase involved in cell wall biosynthesis
MPKSEDLHICLFGDERSIHVRRWVIALRDAGNRIDFITLNKDRKNDIGAISIDAASKSDFIVNSPVIRPWLVKLAPQIYHLHQDSYQAGSKIDYFAKIKPLKSLVRELNPDIFHTHQASSYGFLASYVDHPRKILSVWGDDVVIFPRSNFINRAVVKRALRNANHLTATSHFLKDAVSRLVKSHPDVSVIPFGIDLNFLRPVQRAPKSSVRVGIIKWLKPKYGIDILIRAFDLVIKGGYNAELVIAGRGDYEAEYKRLAAQLGLSDKVTFCGYFDHDRIPEFLGALDIFAMPSINDGESFGVAALEASATALPVVATKVGGVPEVVKDGVTGILVERSNVAQLAEALIRLIEDPELRTEMGRAGRAYVEKKYRWEDNVADMIKLYREML